MEAAFSRPHHHPHPESPPLWPGAEQTTKHHGTSHVYSWYDLVWLSIIFRFFVYHVCCCTSEQLQTKLQWSNIRHNMHLMVYGDQVWLVTYIYIYNAHRKLLGMYCNITNSDLRCQHLNRPETLWNSMCKWLPIDSYFPNTVYVYIYFFDNIANTLSLARFCVFLVRFGGKVLGMLLGGLVISDFLIIMIIIIVARLRNKKNMIRGQTIRSR